MTEIHLDAVTRRYGAATALDGVTMGIRSGEIHALMGENGAGKSTMIRLLAGLEQPDAGTIRLDGEAVRFDAPTNAQRAGLRFIHQELQTVPSLSVAENMHLGRDYPTRAGLINWRALAKASRAALDRLALGHIDPRIPMSRLGPGDQMLARIAATLIAQPGPAPWLYVMDEPTAALTGAEADRLFATIRDLKAQGAGILYVSHRMAEVLALADRVTVLRDGRHISSLSRSQTDQTRIIHDMTGRDLSDIYPARPNSPMSAPVLHLDGLCAPGVGPVSLAIGAGEILGLAGLAGAGRGALLKTLMGALPTGAGTLMIDGRRFQPDSPTTAWAHGIAYVPRERRSEGLVTDASVVQNVALPHLDRLARASVFQNRSGERQLLARLAPEVRLKSSGPGQRVTELSGGNQQKVLFARAMAGKPRVLLLDEPTRGVDVGARADIYRLIRNACDQGLAVILASSDLPELLGLSDRIAVLQAGRLVHLVANHGLTEASLLALCYDSSDRKVTA